MHREAPHRRKPITPRARNILSRLVLHPPSESMASVAQPPETIGEASRLAAWLRTSSLSFAPPQLARCLEGGGKGVRFSEPKAHHMSANPVLTPQTHVEQMSRSFTRTMFARCPIDGVE